MTVAVIAHLIVITLLVTTVAAAASEDYLKDHPIKWFFNFTNNSAFYNYSSLVASHKFYDGDTLKFETTPNVSLIMTYNKTTYDSCSTKHTSLYDTWSYKPKSNQSSVVDVDLWGQDDLIYFFSDAGGGVQCRHGMAFQIFVHPHPAPPPDPPPPPPAPRPPYIEPRIIPQPPPPGFNDLDLPPLPPIKIPAGGSRERENGGVKFGASRQVVACAILFAVYVGLFSSH
ncbi:hypothetical protein Tsubulata_003356 [Turnera subulata]|uniref:Phytocyanin domain-containing protein n=1 Tax=Turnera subulata TaxID=218843 RepID=A0A9Q0GEA9_9ROSI|nr:hypothetical protein Tsubulata_003356 [Turnera subulata]